MTAKKISDFTDGVVLQSGDQLLVARGGQNYAINAGTIANSLVAHSGLYSDLIDAPAPFSGSYTDLTDRPALANVATSGSYLDLTGRPLIPNVPTNVSAFTNDAGYLTANAVANTVTKTSQLINDSGFITQANVATKTSQLTNDSGFITALSNTGVSPGTYTNATITVGVDGRLSFAATGTGGGGSSNTVTSASTQMPLGQSARYWRIRWIATTGNATAGIGEVVFATSAGGPQAATGGTPVASSLNSGTYPPSAAFNGQTDLGWYCASGRNTGEWIGYSFPSAVQIAEIRLTSTTDGDGVPASPRIFALDLSADGLSWLQAAIFNTAFTATGQTLTFSVPALVYGSNSTSTGGSTGSIYPYAVLPMTAPKAADFSDTSQQWAGPITATDLSDAGLYVSTIPVSGDKPTAILKALPATGDWQVEARIVTNSIGVNFHSLGFAFTDASSNNLHVVGPDMSGSAFNLQHSKYNRSSGGGYSQGLFAVGNYGGLQYLRVKYSAANATNSVYASLNGREWRKIATMSDSALGGKFDRIGLGFGLNYSFGGDTEAVEAFFVPHWKQSF